jgi:hypothetical protein
MAINANWLLERLEEIKARRHELSREDITSENAVQAYAVLNQHMLQTYDCIEWLAMQMEFVILEEQTADFEKRVANNKSRAAALTEAMAKLDTGTTLLRS